MPCSGPLGTSMKRRQFITLLGGAAAWPATARAQQAAMPVIGYLSAGSPEIFAQRLRAFRLGLSEVGYMEGRNVAVEYRWSGDRSDQLPAMAADLVRRGVSVIAVDGPAVLPAKAATSTIPIVFYGAADPVASGYVASLNRPGANLTGVTNLGAGLQPKRLELLHEAVPAAKSFALLVNSSGANAERQIASVETPPSSPRPCSRSASFNDILDLNSDNRDHLA
jgi:putative tryptophan/tyrosine transport system substrate-binding protein